MYYLCTWELRQKLYTCGISPLELLMRNVQKCMVLLPLRYVRDGVDYGSFWSLSFRPVGSSKVSAFFCNTCIKEADMTCLLHV